MNQIGFRILRFKEGPMPGLTLNQGDWIKKVVDIRDILKLYNCQDETKFALFMSFSESGAYLTIARPISGRSGDNTAAWLYIPNNIEVSGTEMISIIDIVKEELAAPKSNAGRLTELFSKTYPQIEAADYLPSAANNVYARREVGYYPLKDIVGEKRYQPNYAKYAAILIDTKDGMPIADKSVVDISMERMVETFVFCPPRRESLPSGVTVHLGTPGQPLFNKPVRLYKSRVEVIFKRPGFQDIPYYVDVERNNQTCDVPALNWNLSISRSMFRIVASHDPSRDLTGNAAISINGHELRLSKVMELNEREAQNAAVSISLPGFEPKTEKINLLTAPNPTVIGLHRAEQSRTWEIKLSNGHFAEMTLKSKYLHGGSMQSPLRGFEIDPNTRRLEYSDFGTLKQRAIGFGAAAVLALLIWGIVALCGWYGSHTFKWQLGWPPLVAEKIAESGENLEATDGDDDPATMSDQTGENDSSLNAAIAYLDRNEEWNMDSMRQYRDLDGLFDEMNNYEFEKIRARAATLVNSRRFVMLVNTITSLNGKKISGSYCGRDDHSITVSNYIKKLEREAYTSQPEPQVAPEHKHQTVKEEGSLSKAANKAQKAQNGKNAKDGKKVKEKAGAESGSNSGTKSKNKRGNVN